MKRTLLVLVMLMASSILNAGQAVDTKKAIYPKISPIECPGKLELMMCREALLIKAYIEKLRESGEDEFGIFVRLGKKFTPDIIKDRGLRDKVKKRIAELEKQGEAKLTLSEGYFEFGPVKQSKGVVKKSMKIYNKGKADLVITNIKSLCKCTTMAYKAKGVMTPFYGPDGANTDLNIVLKPDESAELIVKVDLKDDTVTPGQLTRYVLIDSNDYLYPEGQIAVRAMVQ